MSYDSLPTTLPLVKIAGKTDPRLLWERRLRSLLAGEGMTSNQSAIHFETIESNFHRTLVADDRGGDGANPLAKENAEMRLSLIPGLIDNLRLNLAHKVKSFHAYHLGKVFCSAASAATRRTDSRRRNFAGPRASHGLRLREERPIGFLECKGWVEAALGLFRLEESASWSAAN